MVKAWNILLRTKLIIHKNWGSNLLEAIVTLYNHTRTPSNGNKWLEKNTYFGILAPWSLAISPTAGDDHSHQPMLVVAPSILPFVSQVTCPVVSSCHGYLGDPCIAARHPNSESWNTPSPHLLPNGQNPS
jgi:hypothetical protein